MKEERANRCDRKIALRWIVVVVCLLIFGTGAWASSKFFRQISQPERWRPRKLPVGAELVGDRACMECHGRKNASYLKTGMSSAMETIVESKVLTANPQMTFRNGNYRYEIKRQGAQSFYSVTDGKDTISLPILYALGVGTAGQTYVLQYDGGFYESKVSFYNEIRGLDYTIGTPRGVPPSLKEALGRKISDNEVTACFSCHSTGAVIGGQVHFDRLTPGIRCEACHGPGGAHTTVGKAGRPNEKLIFNPGRLNGDELSQDFCGSCHRGSSEVGLLKGEEVNNVRFQPYRIFHSKCYSDDRRISCVACHDPHEPLNHDAAHYDAKCAACHETKKPGSKSRPGQQSLLAGCPVGTKDCTSCHMPKLGPEAAHFKFTDHYIRIVKASEKSSN